MNDPRPAIDLPRITLQVLALVTLSAASVWVMRPFIPAMVWAAMIVIASWPILLAVQARLGGRRGPAVVVMVVALLALLLVPTWLGISAIVNNVDRAEQFIRSIATKGLPPLPSWVGRVPFFGTRLSVRWQDWTEHPEALVAGIQPSMEEAASWIVSKAGGLGATIVQFALTVLLSGIFYASGEKAARSVLRFLRRLAGERGESVGRLAGKAVRAVALGIVVTAVVQTILAGAGFLLASVPFAGVLTAVVFILCIAQVGPLFVVAPATIWLYMSGATGRGTVLLVFSILAITLDNVIRPLLIKKGADLPLLLIMAGVIGGVIGFGVVGLFIGPVLLAVTWTLFVSWTNDLDPTPVVPSRPGDGPKA
jgi:predicted PurR-regulated permease PerM